jgi:antitoxin CptB
MVDVMPLRWQCRRGRLELDVLLERFLAAHEATLDTLARAAFERLLALEDDPLLDVLLGRVPAPDADTAALAARIRDA